MEGKFGIDAGLGVDVDLTLNIDDMILLSQCVMTIAQVTGDPFIADLYEKVFMVLEPYGTYKDENDDEAY